MATTRLSSYDSVFFELFAPFCGYFWFLSFLCVFAPLREIFSVFCHLFPELELPILVREDVFNIKRMIEAVMCVHQIVPPIRDYPFLRHPVDLADLHGPVLLLKFTNANQLTVIL